MTRKPSPLVEAAEAALLDTERAEWEAFAAALQHAETDTQVLRERFFTWAGPLAERIGQPHPGPLWGALQGLHAPPRSARQVEVRPLAELADELPYPLGMKLRDLLQQHRAALEGEAAPQLPFQICAVMGVLVRLAALISIRAYADTGGRDAELNRKVVDSLRAPADGAWLEVAGRLSKALTSADTPPVVKTLGAALQSKPPLDRATADRARDAKGAKVTGVTPALQALVGFRNALVHGEPIGPADIERAMALLEVAVRGFAPLARYHLTVRHAGKTWQLNGAVPRPVESAGELPDDEPCLVHEDGREPPLSLSPLLRFASTDSDLDVEFDELYFLNAGSLERLSYIGYRVAGQLDGKTLGSYDAFKALLASIPTPPIPQDPRIDFSDLAAFHSRLFVGRSDVLDEIAACVAQPPTQYVFLKALAGMGKSAILGVLHQAVLNAARPEAERQACPADRVVRPTDRWTFHFCMSTDGRNSPTVAIRSLIAQICDHFQWDRKPWLSHDLDELKDRLFPSLLLKASGALDEGQRLVVAIDALDEGIGADKESIPSCIPAGTYDGVLFLLSYRVDASGHSSRVEGQLKQLPDGRRTVLTSANPLSGLDREDVDRFLDKVAEQRGNVGASPRVRDAVWSASTADSPTEPPTADPFYLRFLAEGIQGGSVRLDRAETVPESLDDAFEELWMGLPTDRDFLCHRVLLTLGILREYGEDALFSELFNRELPPDQQLTPDDVAAVRVKAGKLLVYDGDRYGLFHDRFRRFLVGEQKDPIAEALGDA